MSDDSATKSVMETQPAVRRRWFQFRLASVLIAIGIAAFGTHWFVCHRRAAAAQAEASKVINQYESGTVLESDVVLALYQALDAKLAVPSADRRAAYEAHMRHLGELRLGAEHEFPGSGRTRPIVVFTSHYELAKDRLAEVAAEAYADAVDREFDFPYRDQFKGHPAAERGI